MTPRGADKNDRQRLLNVSGAYRSRAWAALACMLTGIAVAGLAPAGEVRSWLAPLAIGASLGVALGVLRSSRLRAERALAEEQHWLQGLPFSFVGWWALLADDFSRPPPPASTTAVAYARLRVVLEFTDSAPEAKQLHERLLAARIVELAALEVSPSRAELTLAVAQARIARDLGPVVHRLLDDALKPLHGEHPLSRVAISRVSAPVLDNK